MAQCVKLLVLLLEWLGLLLWRRFDSWPWNFYVLQAQQRKKRGGEVSYNLKTSQSELFELLVL